MYLLTQCIFGRAGLNEREALGKVMTVRPHKSVVLNQGGVSPFPRGARGLTCSTVISLILTSHLQTG